MYIKFYTSYIKIIIHINLNIYLFSFFLWNKSKIYNQSAYHALIFIQTQLYIYIYEYIIHFPMSAITSLKHFFPILKKSKDTVGKILYIKYQRLMCY